ncbi:uncharacterized protein [Ptychodera flava]|uniref:uncharacterized protein n=1 Tax=Ptychodera flava TaxID=63121 RepID=UPI00396A0211
MTGTKFTVVLVALSISFAHSLKPREIGHVSIQRPGYSSVFKYSDEKSFDLFVTSFEAAEGTEDEIYMVRDIGSKLKNLGQVVPEVLSKNVDWPNEVKKVPDDVFGEDGYIWAATGFMVAGKMAGYVGLLNPKKHGMPDVPNVISVNPGDVPWFYHRVEWIDMNNDGLKDALTARTFVEDETSDYVYHADLVWFQNPGGLSTTSTPWQLHVLVDGPDCFFHTVELTLPDGTTKLCVISTQYFTEKLTVTWTDDPNGSWANPDDIRHRVIDQDRGHYFDLVIDDLNNDGRLDLMVTVNKNWGGHVMAYEIPDNFITDDWPAHLLAEGFDGGYMYGRGAPGSGFTFRPASEPNRKKPVILISGDDDGMIYLIQPYNDDDSNDWQYHKTVIFTTPGMVGSVSLVDVDNDGYEEIFIPAWSTQKLHILTFAPLR